MHAREQITAKNRRSFSIQSIEGSRKLLPLKTPL
jgi:hypothetical protein